jgi:2-keto-4-pentenoate hydratase/2-oxohepta-3-ene-1,7-dioic acid hydratase in catechol pathway
LFCVGLNYADHAAENNLHPPETPIFFTKLASVVIPHGTPIPLPHGPDQVDYEAEMAVVIGQRADRVSPEQAHACIAGYTIINDVSARDLQRNDKQWFRGKNCNGFGPLGPWLVTADEIGDPGNLAISLRLNGEVRQHSNTRNLIFPPAALISILSQTLVLEPGDLISTGTPAGVGFHMKPQIFLKAGDRVVIEVEGIGVLENGVVER